MGEGGGMFYKSARSFSDVIDNIDFYIKLLYEFRDQFFVVNSIHAYSKLKPD